MLEFKPSVDKHGRWSVKVQRVDKDGNFVKDEDARWHSTSPAPRDLAEVLGKPEMKPRRAPAAKSAPDVQEPKTRKPRAADVAPNGIKVGDRVMVAPSGKGPQRDPYEASVMEIEVDAAPAYGGTAFKVAADDAKPDGRGTGWVGIDRVSAVAANAEPVAGAEAKPKIDAAAIEDFGETLHGARKHYAAAYAERMRQAYELDLATTPLSKSWPEPDYQKLLDSGAEPFSVAWVLARAKQLLSDLTPKKLKDAQRPSWLAALATRHLTELGADYFTNINHYSDYLAEMQADRNLLQGEAEVVAEAARKWVSKNKAESQQLFDLMHDATVDGVDPSKAYQPLMFKMPGQKGQFQVTKKNIKHAIDVKKQQMKERSGDSKVNMINEIKALEAMGYAEPRRQKQYVPLVERWNQLPAEAQSIYKQFRDSYRQRSDAMEDALAQRIEDLSGDGVSEAQRRKLVQRMREQFESARLQGVYFPLQRFGQHYVSAEKDDTNTFMMFQTLNELERAVKDLKAKGWTITAQGKKGDKTSAKDAPSGTFVADVIQQLRQSHVSDKVQDEIYQLYLEALPELSMRKHSIHRKGIPGFDPDAVRAFAYNMHHGCRDRVPRLPCRGPWPQRSRGAAAGAGQQAHRCQHCRPCRVGLPVDPRRRPRARGAGAVQPSARAGSRTDGRRAQKRLGGHPAGRRGPHHAWCRDHVAQGLEGHDQGRAVRNAGGQYLARRSCARGCESMAGAAAGCRLQPSRGGGAV